MSSFYYALCFYIAKSHRQSHFQSCISRYKSESTCQLARLIRPFCRVVFALTFQTSHKTLIMNSVNDTSTADDDDDDDVSTLATDNASFVKVEHPPEVPTLTLSCAPRFSIIGTNAGLSKTQACATIKARNLPADDDEHTRAPIDIVVALDVSKSMNGQKLNLCKESLALLVKSLLPSDRFGLIIFSDNAVVKIPIQKLSEEIKERALQLVESLEVQCRTNISEAILLATQMMHEVTSPNAVQTIFLLTDGLANKGIKRVDGIVELVEAQYAEKESPVEDGSWALVSHSNEEVSEFPPTKEEPKGNRAPITIHCFGYGSNHDSEMLLGISQVVPGGSYYYVENNDDIFGAFGDSLGGVFSVVAQNVVLTAYVPEQASSLAPRIVKVHHRNAVQYNDKSYSVTIGDLYAEETRDIVVEVELEMKTFVKPANIADYWITHAKFGLSYIDTLSNEFICCDPVSCDIARIKNSSVISAENPLVQVQCLRVRATEAIDDAQKIASKGDVFGAQEKVERMIRDILNTTDDVRACELVKQLLQDLQRCRDGLDSYQTFVDYGSHTMRNTFQSHGSQRCMDSLGGARANVYRSSTKAKTLSYFEEHST